MLLACKANQMKNPPPQGPRPPQRVPLTALAARSLREAMNQGHWQEHLPGERELCAMLQVSRQTLRSALAQLREEGVVAVSSRQRWRILKLPDAAGEAPASSRVVAAISPRPIEQMNPSAIVMVDQLRADLARAGLELVIHVSTTCFGEKPARALDALTRRSPAAVWLLFGSLGPMQQWFVRQEIPCIVVGSCMKDVPLPSVDINYRALCRHAGALLRRKGHRSIAFVRPAGEFGGDMESEEGLREALAGSDDAKLHVIRHNGTPAHLCALLERIEKQPQPPTAFLVARALHALTLVTCLLQKGRRIPRDTAVISRDDDLFLSHAVPEVTRYASSPLLFARKLCHTIRQMTEGAGPPRDAIRLMPSLIAGESV